MPKLRKIAYRLLLVSYFCPPYRQVWVAPSMVSAFSLHSFLLWKNLYCKTLYCSSVTYFTFLYYFQLSSSPFFHYCQEDWLSILLHRTEILEVAEKVYKTKASWTKFFDVNFCWEESLSVINLFYWFFHLFHKHLDCRRPGTETVFVRCNER